MISILQLLTFFAILSWSLYTIFLVIGLLGLGYRAKIGKTKSNRVEFVIVSIANENVRNSLFECLKHTRAKFPDISLSIVVDEGAEIMEELVKYAQGNNQTNNNKILSVASYGKKTQIEEGKDSLKIIVVPKEYRKDLVAKGRAINYFIEENVQPDKWYVFIDDDNLILDDQFLYEIPLYEQEGFVAFNPTSVAREGKSRFCHLMDFPRQYDDISLYRFFTGLMKAPVIGMHGEVLGIKGSVLREIGFGFNTITEDFRFSIELVKRNLKTWQSNTQVSTKSANSINDALQQRGRVFKGISNDFRFGNFQTKIINGLRLTFWIIAIFGSWSLAPLWLHWNSSAWLILLVGGLYHWIVFFYAIRNTKDLKQILYRMLLVPTFGILDSIAVWIGLRQKGFFVIDKN